MNAGGGVDSRLIQALLRWRQRRLLRRVAPRQQLAVRLLPALLHANFQPSTLKGEALGIESIGTPRGWAMLSRAFSITPPVAAPRGRRLVQAIFAAPFGESVDLFVLAAGQLSEFEEERFAQRLAAAEGILRRGGADVRVVRFLPDRPGALRLLLFAGLVAGSAPVDDLLKQAGGPIQPADAAALVARAPGPFAALAWMLLCRGLDRAPGEILQELHDEGTTASILSDPDLFGALLVAHTLGDRRMCEAASIALSDPQLRRFARNLAGPAAAPAPVRGKRRPGARDRLLELGRELLFAALAAIRTVPRGASRDLRARARTELLSAGYPIALLPALRDASAREPRLKNAEGRGNEQIFLRQLALDVRLELQAPDDLDPFWKRAAALLAEPQTKRTLLLSVEATDEPGPPMDPLNRGPDRRVALRDPLVVLLRPTGRPTARRHHADQAIARMIVEANRGTEIDIVGAGGSSQPTVARLQRVAKLCRFGTGLAIEVGGRVLQVDENGRLRRFHVRRFASRPRRYTADPESPDLSPPTPRGSNSPRRFGVSIDCLVAAVDEEKAGVIYTDDEGFHLREEVPLPFLEEHLKEAQVLLRTAPEPALLAVRVAGSLDATRLRATTGPIRRMEISVEGDIALGLRVGVMDEWFGAECEHGWKAAAAAVLSQWPQAAGGRFVIASMDVTANGEPVGALGRLYARSVVVRRLLAHLAKAP